MGGGFGVFFEVFADLEIASVLAGEGLLNGAAFAQMPQRHPKGAFECVGVALGQSLGREHMPDLALELQKLAIGVSVSGPPQSGQTKGAALFGRSDCCLRLAGCTFDLLRGFPFCRTSLTSMGQCRPLAGNDPLAHNATR